MRQKTKERHGRFFILNIGRAGIWKMAYPFIPRRRAKLAGRCDSEGELGSVLRRNLLIPGASEKRAGHYGRFKQLLNDHTLDSTQRTPAAYCLFPDVKKQRNGPRGKKVDSQR